MVGDGAEAGFAGWARCDGDDVVWGRAALTGDTPPVAGLCNKRPCGSAPGAVLAGDLVGDFT